MSIKLENKYRIDQILGTLSKLGYRSSIVAGGVVRDAYFNLPINDIDIYIQHPNFMDNKPATAHCYDVGMLAVFGRSDVNLLDHMHGEFFNHLFTNKTTKPSHSGVNHQNDIVEIFSAYEPGPSYTRIEYQLIFTKDKPVNFVNDNFHIGLSKAYYDGQRMRFTHDFMHDADNKLLTVMGKNMTRTQFERIKTHYLPKMRQKFPDHDVKLAPYLQHSYSLA